MVRFFSRIFAILFILFISVNGIAEVMTSINFTQLENLSLLDVEANEWSFTNVSGVKVSFQSKGNTTVQSQFDLKFLLLGANISMDIYRAFMKIRFPDFRIILGKQKLTWGDGTFFNTGDILYDSISLSNDLTADILRDNASWLSEIYFPLGLFSFIEGVILLPEVNLAKENPADIKESGVGGRVVGKISKVKLETGYTYKGDMREHQMYVSLKSSFIFDFYLSLFSRITEENEDPDFFHELYDESIISCGIFNSFSIVHGSNLSIILEALIRPTASWKEFGVLPDDDYGLYLFTELLWNLPTSASITLSLRDIFSPIDLSTLLSTGLVWNISTGFSLLHYVSVALGEENDTYSWYREGSLAFSIGFRFIY